MSVTLTAAGETLIARLQAEGSPLVIDKFLFADVPTLDHTLPANPAQGVPSEHVVHEFAIPQEYRAFVAPNQVVYSALLGSDIGTFTFNWQGLYCSEHETLVALATFPRLEKRRYDAATNTQGNNLTRNFLLEFTGATELTQITVEAAVWQLDFTVRLKGIDERERLSNRDIYGRAAFLDDGWLLTATGDNYRFEPGRGYVEGIRAALGEPLPVVPINIPCDVWLDVCMQGQGSDVVTVVSPLTAPLETACPDYTGAPPAPVQHYCELVARIEADGTVTDLRPRAAEVLGQTLGVASLAEVGAHAARTDNPHQVTAAQVVGLGAATATAPGLVELATPAETQAGTDDTRAVTPAGLAAALGGLSPAQCRAWVLFDGSTTPPTIKGSYNVLGVTRHGVGDYTVSFVEPMPSAHYAVCGTSTGTQAGETEDAHGLRPNYYASDTPLTAGSVRVRTDRDTGTSAGGAAVDSTFTSVAVFA